MVFHWFFGAQLNICGRRLQIETVRGAENRGWRSVFGKEATRHETMVFEINSLLGNFGSNLLVRTRSWLIFCSGIQFDSMDGRGVQRSLVAQHFVWFSDMLCRLMVGF